MLKADVCSDVSTKFKGYFIILRFKFTEIIDKYCAVYKENNEYDMVDKTMSVGHYLTYNLFPTEKSIIAITILFQKKLKAYVS